jgi:hypothetical protein
VSSRGRLTGERALRHPADGAQVRDHRSAGSGKSTQTSELDLVQISVGDIFRWHVKELEQENSFLKMRNLLRQGKRAPEA